MGNQIVSTEPKFLSKELKNAERAVEFRLNGKLVLKAELDKLPAEVQLHAALFGISQSVGDTCANLVKTRDVVKAEAAIADRWATMLESWSKTEKGPRRTVSLEELTPVVSKLMGQDMSAVLKAMSVPEANAVAAEKSVAAAIAQDRAAKAKAAAAQAPKSALSDLMEALAAKKAGG